MQDLVSSVSVPQAKFRCLADNLERTRGEPAGAMGLGISYPSVGMDGPKS